MSTSAVRPRKRWSPAPAFTHVSYDDVRILRTNLLEQGSASTQDRLVPYTIFIDPQLGRVGLSESEARTQGRNACVAKLPMTAVTRALELIEMRGFMKAIVDADTQQILGRAILGLEGSELMNYHPGGDARQSALYRVTRRHFHPSHPG